MLTYSQAAELVGLCGSHKLTYNTYLRREGEDFIIALYGTDIVTIKDDHTYVLRTGGFKTILTRDRICDYAPISIGIKKGKWFLRDGTEFVEGMRVTSAGEVYTPEPPLPEAPPTPGVKAGPAADLLDAMIAWESGELDEDEMVALFQSLIDSGLAWSLQGCYGRQASRLLEAGLCTQRS
jgi:hypothetical protein